MGAIEGKALVFDIVGTISSYEGAKGNQVRHGLPALLQEYSQAGNSLYLATSDTDSFADGVAKRLGIAPYLTQAWGVGRDQYGKRYQRIADDLGYTPDQSMANMIITGDDDRDMPADLGHVVFVYDPYGEAHDAQVFGLIAARLYDAGQGHFYEGFESLRGDGVRKDLGDGVTVSFDTMHLDTGMGGRRTIPRVRVVEASQWMRDLQKVQTTSLSV